MKKFAVYILACTDGSFYTGIINNVFQRAYEHNQGLDPKA